MGSETREDINERARKYNLIVDNSWRSQQVMQTRINVNLGCGTLVLFGRGGGAAKSPTETELTAGMKWKVKAFRRDGGMHLSELQ